METKELETTESQTQEDSDEKYTIEDDKEREVKEIKLGLMDKMVAKTFYNS